MNWKVEELVKDMEKERIETFIAEYMDENSEYFEDFPGQLNEIKEELIAYAEEAWEEEQIPLKYCSETGNYY